MIHSNRLDKIRGKLENIKKLINKNKLQVGFDEIDNYMWEAQIYELSISWYPDIKKSSKDDYLEVEESILKVMNDVMPTQRDKSIQLKNTFEILHIAGEIGFEEE